MSDITAPLEAQAIHIWQIDLLNYPDNPTWLNLYEQQRLAQFQNSQAARRFCATRNALRYLLGSYMQLAPVDVPLLINPQGKPYVEGNNVQFNVSHTGDLAVMAFSRCAAVGVDVELPRKIKNMQAIAKRTFAPQNQQQLAESGYTPEAFFRHWVHFEAKQKCIGQGIFGTTAHDVAYHATTLANGAHFCVAWQQTCDNPALHFFELK